jgi:hypothetical protein
MKEKGANRGKAPLNLMLGATWRLSGQGHAPAALLQGKRTSTHSIGGCVDSRVSVDIVENNLLPVPRFETQIVKHQAWSLGWPRYPDPKYHTFSDKWAELLFS